MQRAQGVVLFFSTDRNGFEFYVVTRSYYSSRLFLCALDNDLPYKTVLKFHGSPHKACNLNLAGTDQLAKQALLSTINTSTFMNSST